jgi:hypothetical protein
VPILSNFTWKSPKSRREIKIFLAKKKRKYNFLGENQEKVLKGESIFIWWT